MSSPLDYARKPIRPRTPRHPRSSLTILFTLMYLSGWALLVTVLLTRGAWLTSLEFRPLLAAFTLSFAISVAGAIAMLSRAIALNDGGYIGLWTAAIFIAPLQGLAFIVIAALSQMF